MRNKQTTLNQFLNLKPEDQDEILFNQGIFLLKRSLGKKSFALYAVEKFFVELEYHKMRIVRKQAFVKGIKLNEYAPLDAKSLLEKI